MLHYIITRFNLRLWAHDKRGRETQTQEWLEERFRLFEAYCLPSVARQTESHFVWLVLFDSETPVKYIERIRHYQKICPQFTPIRVRPEHSLRFVEVIQNVVSHYVAEKRKEAPDETRLLTTYLDNDDALRLDFVERVQAVAERMSANTFISFVNGLQYYTELEIATHIRYRNNHFVSFVEEVCPEKLHVKTVYGYGSHYYIDTYKKCKCQYEKTDRPMWMEVVHTNNVDNDVLMTRSIRLVTCRDSLKDFGLDRLLSVHSRRIYYTCFFLRRLKEIVRHAKFKLFGHDWWK